MARVRISEIANEVGYPSKEVIDKALELGIKVESQLDYVSLEDAEKLYEYINSGVAPKTLPQDDLTKYLKQTKLTKDTTIGIGIAVNSEINIHKEFLAKVKKKIITENMLYDCLFSLNKRAKNCRDKKNEYWRSEYKWDYIERMDEYYRQKDFLLKAILKPTLIHRQTTYNYYGNKNILYFLFYEMSPVQI